MPDENERRPGEGASRSEAGHRDTTNRTPCVCSVELTLPGLELDGLALRDEALEAVEAAAHTGWRLLAQERLDLLIGEGNPFTAEHLRALTGEPLATNPSVLGALIRKAAQAGEIVAVGFTTATRPAAHGRTLRVWRGVG